MRLEDNPALRRELEYHERLYAGFAQKHFARPAVVALREHMAARILRVAGAERGWRVLSLGCGLGDTELLIAPRVKELVGIDLSPAAIRQAQQDARRAGAGNALFREGTLDTLDFEPGSFDLVFAVFFLHHLDDASLEGLPSRVARLLRPGGVFYSLDPSRYRLSGAVGSLLFPGLMRRYQSPDERQLDPGVTARIFKRHGFSCRADYYDFASSPLAGLLPGWRAGYRAARVLDELLIRVPGLRRLGSNFELVGRL